MTQTLKSRLYWTKHHLICGLHSGVPWCCVVWYVIIYTTGLFWKWKNVIDTRIIHTAQKDIVPDSGPTIKKGDKYYTMEPKFICGRIPCGICFWLKRKPNFKFKSCRCYK